MRYKVPQKIDLEDRIFGPLTMRQFGFVFGGGVIDYLLFNTVYPIYGTSVFVITATLPTLIALSLAFVKIQDRPFLDFLMSYALFSSRPKILIWDRTPDPMMRVDRAKSTIKAVPPRKVIKSDLAQLANIVDTRGWKAEETNAPLPSGQNLSGRVITKK